MLLFLFIYSFSLDKLLSIVDDHSHTLCSSVGTRASQSRQLCCHTHHDACIVYDVC